VPHNTNIMNYSTCRRHLTRLWSAVQQTGSSTVRSIVYWKHCQCVALVLYRTASAQVEHAFIVQPSSYDCYQRKRRTYPDNRCCIYYAKQLRTQRLQWSLM